MRKFNAVELLEMLTREVETEIFGGEGEDGGFGLRETDDGAALIALVAQVVPEPGEMVDAVEARQARENEKKKHDVAIKLNEMLDGVFEGVGEADDLDPLLADNMNEEAEPGDSPEGEPADPWDEFVEREPDAVNSLKTGAADLDRIANRLKRARKALKSGGVSDLAFRLGVVIHAVKELRKHCVGIVDQAAKEVRKHSKATAPR